jgi:hypothetical protein
MSVSSNKELVERLEVVSNKIIDNMVTACQIAIKTCVTCDSFNQVKETCNLNGLRPPAKIIAFGCECFTQDVPF